MKPSAILFLLLIGLPFVVGLGDSAVWDSNEAFYVQTPREMVGSGDWVVPTFNDRLRLNKPPLAYWLVAAAYQVFGVSLEVQRWVMALLAIGCTALVYAIGRLTMSGGGALLAAGIFATTFRFLVLSRRLLIDVLLLACILAALYFFLRWLIDDSRRALMASAVAAGLGCLAKGPVAVVPLIPVALWLWGRGQLGRRRFPALLAAAGVVALVASSWFVLLWLRMGWEPVMGFLWTENVGRLTHLDFGPRRGIFYYGGVFLGDFFPWSFLFLAALGAGSRRGEAVSGRFESLWLLWIAAYLVLFSLSYNKQEYYILPVYPVAALWLAPRLGPLLSRRSIAAAVAVLIVVVAGLLAAAALPLAGAWSWIPPLLLAAGVVPLWRRCPLGIVACLSLTATAAFALYLKPLDRFQPVPRLADRFRELRLERGHDEARIGYYRLAVPSLRYYLDRPVDEFVELEAAVEALRSPRPVYLVVGDSEYAQLRASVGEALRVEGVEPKLYTTARTLWQGLRTSGTERPWTRPVYLVSNQGRQH